MINKITKKLSAGELIIQIYNFCMIIYHYIYKNVPNTFLIMFSALKVTLKFSIDCHNCVTLSVEWLIYAIIHIDTEDMMLQVSGLFYGRL